MNTIVSDTSAREALASQLAALIERATDDDLADGGRYFHDSCDDLTKCGHGDTGEYQHSADGKLVEFLWNNRRLFLASLPSLSGEWEPIETAPKDGRELLLYGVCWDKKLRGKYAPDINVGWFTGNGEWVTRSLVEGITPTHWRPLPAPPAMLSATPSSDGERGK